jgi:hypothetical protein
VIRPILHRAEAPGADIELLSSFGIDPGRPEDKHAKEARSGPLQQRVSRLI